MAQVFEKWDDIITKKEAANNETKSEAVVTDSAEPKPATNDDTQPTEEEASTRTQVNEIAEEITDILKSFSDTVWLKIQTIVWRIVEKVILLYT